MGRGEIQVFSISWLDFLSCTLGSMILLFVIVPKLDTKLRDELLKIKELENLKAQMVNIDVLKKQLNETLKKIENTVAKDDYEELKQKFNNFDQTTQTLNLAVEELEKRLKELQIQLQRSEEERSRLLRLLEDTNKNMEETKKQLAQCETEREKLRRETEPLRQQIVELEEKVKQLEEQLKKCVSGDKSATDLIAILQKENEELKKKVDQIQASPAPTSTSALEEEILDLKDQINQLEKKKTAGLSLDKNLVIMLDVSGSMDDEPEPEKLDNVKAGLKMLIATMDESFNVDIVIFPQGAGEGQDYQAFFNKLVSVNKENKYLIYNEVSKLYARNCTPTRAVFEHVFNHDAYKDASTIIFLSDGLPTYRKGTDCPTDPTNALLMDIKKMNNGRCKINTIGVGAAYRNLSSTKPEVQFMKDLAKQNKGFYIGF